MDPHIADRFYREKIDENDLEISRLKDALVWSLEIAAIARVLCMESTHLLREHRMIQINNFETKVRELLK